MEVHVHARLVALIFSHKTEARQQRIYYASLSHVTKLKVSDASGNSYNICSQPIYYAARNWFRPGYPVQYGHHVTLVHYLADGSPYRMLEYQTHASYGSSFRDQLRICLFPSSNRYYKEFYLTEYTR